MLSIFFHLAILMWKRLDKPLWASSLQGRSIKYVTLFLANFDPPCHTFVAHPGTPQKYVTHLGPPPIFTRPSTKNPDKSPLYKFSLNYSSMGAFVRGLLSRGLLSGNFCPG